MSKLMENIIEYYVETIGDTYGYDKEGSKRILMEALQDEEVEEAIMSKIDEIS